MCSVRLDPLTEKRLRQLARERGVPISHIIREALRDHCDAAIGDSLAQRLADVLGSVAGPPARSSRKTGKSFTRLLTSRRGKRP